jgi:hypothetical protein
VPLAASATPASPSAGIRLGGRLNGWDVGEQARRLRPGVPVVYTSGYSIAPARDVPDNMFFNKPNDPDDILTACRISAWPLFDGIDRRVRECPSIKSMAEERQKLVP